MPRFCEEYPNTLVQTLLPDNATIRDAYSKFSLQQIDLQSQQMIISSIQHRTPIGTNLKFPFFQGIHNDLFYFSHLKKELALVSMSTSSKRDCQDFWVSPVITTDTKIKKTRYSYCEQCNEFVLETDASHQHSSTTKRKLFLRKQHTSGQCINCNEHLRTTEVSIETDNRTAFFKKN